MAIYADQLQSFQLAGGGAVTGDTTLTLKAMKDIDGSNVSMTSFGAIGYGTIEPGNSTLEEQISFTGITQNSNGTATLTGVSHITFATPYTSTSGLSKTHAGSTIFVISNTSGWYNEAAFKRNDETITGSWSVPLTPLTNANPASKQYVDNLVSGGTIVNAALQVPGTAGETVSAGQVLYQKVADGFWYKASSALSSTTDFVQLGIAQGSGTAGNAITNGVLLRGIDNNQSGLALGTLYYLSTGGSISSSAGTVERVVGQGRSATALYFDPTFYYVPTANDKGASTGYRDTPSSSNTFVTSVALETTALDQSQTTQDTTSTVGEADTTTRHNKLAQSFIPTNKRIRGVALYKSADTGSFTGTVTVALQADSAGVPSGSNLASVTVSNVNYLALGTGPQDFIFSSEYSSITIGALYWIVISTSTADNGNHPNLGANSAGGYASGTVKYNNTTDGWTTVATIDLYFKTYVGQSGTIPAGSSAGAIPSDILPFTSPVVNVYTSTGANTWTKPTTSSFRYVIVEVQAAGGGGGGVAGTNRASSGGGAGGYARKKINASALNVTETATVGALGAGGVGDADGADGGASSFGTHCTTTGGNKGLKSSADAVVGGGAGGTGTGNFAISGGTGGSGVSNTTANVPMFSGAGGSSFFGKGGNGLFTIASINEAAGNAGVGYGAGGGGASQDTGSASLNGGAGTNGVIIVTEYYL